MELPTSVTSLIGFLTVAYLGSLGALVKYFFSYITTKNGHIERISKEFSDAMQKQALMYEKRSEDREQQHQIILDGQSNRHREMMDDAFARLEAFKPGR